MGALDISRASLAVGDVAVEADGSVGRESVASIAGLTDIIDAANGAEADVAGHTLASRADQQTVGASGAEVGLVAGGALGNVAADADRGVGGEGVEVGGAGSADIVVGAGHTVGNVAKVTDSLAGGESRHASLTVVVEVAELAVGGVAWGAALSSRKHSEVSVALAADVGGAAGGAVGDVALETESAEGVEFEAGIAGAACGAGAADGALGDTAGILPVDQSQQQQAQHGKLEPQ